MKTIGKTKILRLPGLEVYFKKIEVHYQGEATSCIRWERMEKDLSAICQCDKDSKFHSMESFQFEPKLFATPIRPVPENYATDLLGPYAALEYALGHEPMKPLHLR